MDSVGEPTTQERRQEIREGRPFLVIFTIVVLAIYFSTLVSTPQARLPGRLIPFTLVMAVHLVLHWICPYLVWRPALIYPYFAVQSVLICAAAFISQGQGIVLGLFLGLAGEAVGVMEDLRRAAPLVAAILTLAVLTFGVAVGWSNLLGWLVLIIPMAIFVVVYVMLFGRQIRGRQEAQRLLHELETANRQLAEYAARIEDLTLAAERQRMARELHDTLAQGLAGLILQLEAADSHLSRRKPGQAQEIIHQAMARARLTLADARRAIGDLRKEPTPSTDLKEAIKEEVDRFTAATGLPCHIDLALPPAVPVQVSEHAQRVVAEGLSNVARHARASQAWVKARADTECLEICVEDDGVGFDPAQAESRSGHYGLIGLRERARLAGGSLSIDSAPGKGTRLHLRLLLPPKSEAP